MTPTIAALLLASTLTAPPPDVVVVCPLEFRAALAPWIEHRQSQGHTLRLIDAGRDAGEIQRDIRRVAAAGALTHVVLVGDAASAPTSAAIAKRSVATHFETARVNVRWGGSPTIASDLPYADIDNDGVPEVAIGRVPADSPAEVTAVVGKIIDYERAADRSAWRRRMRIVSGASGINPLVDRVVEAAARQLIMEAVPPAYALDYLPAGEFADQLSHPRALGARLRQHACGDCLLWIYAGHGRVAELDCVATRWGPLPLLSVGDLASPPEPAPPERSIAVLVACETGAFDASVDCLAEKLLVSRDGPVAVLAASRISMPYGNTVLGCELLRAWFGDQPPTLGDCLLQAQQKMLAPTDPVDALRLSLDRLARGLSPPPIELAAERREHVAMYHLLGDPLLRIEHPQRLELEAVESASGEGELTIRGWSPLPGTCRLEVIAADSNRRSGGPGGEKNQGSAGEVIAAGHFTRSMAWPEGGSRDYVVRGLVTGERGFALGAVRVQLDRSSERQALRNAPGEPLVK